MEHSSTQSKKLKCFTIAIGLLVSFLFCLVWGRGIDNYLYDTFFAIRGALTPPKEVVIVAIDESSFDEIDLQWPWPRSLHGKLLDSLFKAGAKTVAIDLLFGEPSDNDWEFGEAIGRHKNVVLVNDIATVIDPHYGYVQEKIVEPSSIIHYSNPPPLLGFANMQAEEDGFVRKLSLELYEEEALSLVAARNFASQLNLTIEEVTEEEKNFGRWINFIGPPRSIRTISYYQALEPEVYLPKDLLKDTLVFVGFVTASQATTKLVSIDHYPAPFTRFGGGYYPGVEIHAQAAAGILAHTSIKRLSLNEAQLYGLLAGVVTGFFFVNASILGGGIIWLLLVILSFVGLTYSFSEYSFFASPLYLLGPMSSVFLVNPFLQYWISIRQRRYIRDAFSTYLAPQVVKQVLSDPKRLALGGEEFNATILFLDIAGFTSMSEKLSPKELIEVVNRNLGALAEIILKHEGMIDKFIGDCIMAAWGVPIVTKDHAIKACNAALEIQKILPELAKTEFEKTQSDMSVRIGLSTGSVVAGNVGGGKRFNYTTLGNDVNLSSRLESINKVYGTIAIISDSTADTLPEEYLLRKLDKIKVVGQNIPVFIYELCGFFDETSKEVKEKVSLYHQALDLYFQKKFNEAANGFRKVLEKTPNDKASKLLLERTLEFISNPPPEPWDGVYSMREK